MFRLYGDKVELIRYIVFYIDDGKNLTEGCVSEEHKNEVVQNLAKRGITSTVEIVDQTDHEWFNGLKFNSYDDAVIVFNGGKLPISQEELNAKLISKVNELTLLLQGVIQ